MENGLLFKELLQTPNFRITVVDDADTVEVCGALKVTQPRYFCSQEERSHRATASIIAAGPEERPLCSVHVLLGRIVNWQPCLSLPPLPQPFLGG